jgi:hypothetical protein
MSTMLLNHVEAAAAIVLRTFAELVLRLLALGTPMLLAACCATLAAVVVLARTRLTTG